MLEKIVISINKKGHLNYIRRIPEVISNKGFKDFSATFSSARISPDKVTIICQGKGTNRVSSTYSSVKVDIFLNLVKYEIMNDGTILKQNLGPSFAGGMFRHFYASRQGFNGQVVMLPHFFHNPNKYFQAALLKL